MFWIVLSRIDSFRGINSIAACLTQQAYGKCSAMRLEQIMRTANAELVESLHQFITIWRLIGKPFPQVDGTDRPALAISWPNTRFPFYNFLFMVATAPDSRRKGYGEAVMRRALRRLPLY